MPYVTAAGSPGPFDRKIPSGLDKSISSYDTFAGKISTSAL